MRQSLVVIAFLAALLVTATAMAAYVWWQLGDVEIGLHGKVALVLGSVGSLVLGVGLMRLVYWSHSRGHDTAVQNFDERR